MVLDMSNSHRFTEIDYQAYQGMIFGRYMKMKTTELGATERERGKVRQTERRKSQQVEDVDLAVRSVSLRIIIQRYIVLSCKRDQSPSYSMFGPLPPRVKLIQCIVP
jgi:hypothetical protein